MSVLRIENYLFCPERQESPAIHSAIGLHIQKRSHGSSYLKDAYSFG